MTMGVLKNTRGLMDRMAIYEADMIIPAGLAASNR